MISIKSIDHIVLRTSNIKKMITFYCDLLGCKIEKEQPKLRLTQLRAGDNLIDLIEVDHELDLKQRNLDHFCLRIKPFDFDALYQFFQEKNIEVTQHGMRYGAQGMGYSIYVRDPEGNEIELRELL